jgi:hypothetical protein
MRSRIRAPIKTAPTMDPMTIPAIAPPDRPLSDCEPETAAVEVAADGLEKVELPVDELVENVMKAVSVGRTTLAHLVSAFEL